MAEESRPRPQLILPLAQGGGQLVVVRDEPPHEHRGPEPRAQHPHCAEHFVFTPHCAACLEAERTQPATAWATPIPGASAAEHSRTSADASSSPSSPARKSSRSFGFTGPIPPDLLDTRPGWGRSFHATGWGVALDALCDLLGISRRPF